MRQIFPRHALSSALLVLVLVFPSCDVIDDNIENCSFKYKMVIMFTNTKFNPLELEIQTIMHYQ